LGRLRPKECQTVRTVCRLPRIRRFTEARNLRFHTFEDYLLRLSSEERENFRLAVAAMRLLLLKTLAPRRVAGLGGLNRVPILWKYRLASCGHPTTELSVAIAQLDLQSQGQFLTMLHSAFALNVGTATD